MLCCVVLVWFVLVLSIELNIGIMIDMQKGKRMPLGHLPLVDVDASEGRNNTVGVFSLNSSETTTILAITVRRPTNVDKL